MGKIFMMPDALASQVAAGEVVDRPASVIKELVENSIDAGATQIDVIADRGGAALMRVIDNGSGMGRDDALLSVERHATSKIRDRKDLEKITTLGFRGEALASIASVSKFKLSTRLEEDESGTEVQIDGGKLLNVRDSGGAAGTAIEVRQLFYNMPGRRKFLRAERTEFGHLEQEVRTQAVVNPGIGFSLRHGGKVIFQFPRNQGMLERIRGLIGGEQAERLVEVPQLATAAVSVRGWVGLPEDMRGDRSLRFVFLNGRIVDSPVIAEALREGYAGGVGRGRHPIAFLFLDVDPRQVDVNVHPAKREVRFRDGIGVRRGLAEALQAAFRAHHEAKVEQVISAPNPEVASSPTATASSRKKAALPSLPTAQVAAPKKSTPVLPASPKVAPLPKRSVPVPVAPEVKQTPVQRQLGEDVGEVIAEPEVPEDLKWVGSLSQGYALFESIDGLVMLGRSVARQRVMYEQLLAEKEREDDVPVQRLLMPLTLELSPADCALLLECQSQLAELGLELEAFGGNTIKVEAVPAMMPSDDHRVLLDEILSELRGERSKAAGRSGGLGEGALAARAAAKVAANHRSNRETQAGDEELLAKLMGCEMPYCCPFGKPTLVQQGWPEIERRFGRR